MNNSLHYIGVIETEKYPYRAYVNVYGNSIDTVRQKYENYCDSIGGYIINLYPMDNESNREQYADIAYISPAI